MRSKQKSGELTELGQTLPATDWGLLFVFCPVWYVLFQPTLLEFLAFILVDSIAAVIFLNLEKKVFLERNRIFTPVFPKINDTEVANLDENQKKELYQALTEYPYKRFKNLFWNSFLKITPAYLTVVLFWEYKASFFFQSFKFFAASGLAHAFFFGVFTLNARFFCTKSVRIFHKKYDWSSVFQEKLNDQKDRTVAAFNVQNLLPVYAILGVAALALITQTIIILDDAYNLFQKSLICAGVIGVLSGLLISRIAILLKSIWIDTATHLTDHLKAFNPTEIGSLNPVPLPTFYPMAEYSNVVNQMIKRLHEFEIEVKDLVSVRTEESRFQTIGEISSLLIHDISGPVHVAKFCVDELIENPEKIKDPRYLEQLDRSHRKCISLISGIRSYLRDPRHMGQDPVFTEIHEQVLIFLRMEFDDEGLDEVRFGLDSRLATFKCGIPRSDMVHIILNLYSNAVRNMLDNNVRDPSLRISLTREGLRIRDNGTGLDPAEFEAITSKNYLASSDRPQGLGLRLIRRLIERHGGSLSLENTGEIGTSFLIELKEAQRVMGRNEEERLDYRGL